MNETMEKRELLIQKRVAIQQLIRKLNHEVIRNCRDELTREAAIRTRKALIEADNELNAFELTRII